MWRGPRLLFRMLALLCAFGPLAAALPPRTISTSRQFAIYGHDATQRSVSASIAEEVKTSLLEALGLRDEWRAMIVVLLRQPSVLTPGLPARILSFGQTGSGLKVQLELATGEAGRGLKFRDEILRALLAELSYRERSDLPAGAPFRPPPEWMVEGLSAFFEAQTDDGADVFPPGLFQTLLRAGKEFDPFAFLGRNPAEMDATSRALFRACAYGMVRLLLRDLPEGRKGLVDLLRALPESGRAAVADLPHFCSDLAQGPDSLARWWAIALSRASAPDPRRLLTVAETDRQLNQLLAFPPDPPAQAGDLADMPRRLADRKKRPTAIAQLAGARAGLVALQVRAHPLARPNVLAAIQLTDLVLARKEGQLKDRLKALAAARQTALQAGEAVADYLNWFEATQSGEVSGLFQPPRREETPAPRNDAISEYLDALESELAGPG
ncbi:MAG: hypothetical protein JSR82_10945 [Verrucomicrobia bacterium]|nr:hypothetical protein [Verrucomicrobiota bacterium]